MTNYPYILFNQSPEQLRRIGARGGRTQARNRRLRRLAQAQPRQPIAGAPDPAPETPAEAIAALDAQFPWLRGAEQRKAHRRPHRWIASLVSPPVSLSGEVLRTVRIER